MYFKKLSLETLNESNQWNVLSEGDYPKGGYAMNYLMPELKSTLNQSTLPPVQAGEGSTTMPSIADKLSNWGQKLGNAYSAIKQKQDHIDAQKFGAAYKLINPNSAADSFNPDLSTSTSSISDTFSNSWDKFINNVESLYTNAKTSGAQFMADHQSGLNRVGGFFTGVLSKSLFDYFKNWLFPPEVQQVAQDSNKMSALASAGIGAAATAGVLGLIWLFKKWKNKGQVTNQDIQYAARLNQMKPEDIPEEDKNKPIEA